MKTRVISALSHVRSWYWTAWCFVRDVCPLCEQTTPYHLLGCGLRKPTRVDIVDVTEDLLDLESTDGPLTAILRRVARERNTDY